MTTAHETEADEVIRKETMLYHPDVRQDADAMRQLLADDFVEIDPTGRRWTVDEVVAAVVAQPRRDPRQLSDVRAVRIGTDAYLLTYRVNAVRYSSIWTSDGTAGWRVRYNQQTLIKDFAPPS